MINRLLLSSFLLILGFSSITANELQNGKGKQSTILKAVSIDGKHSISLHLLNSTIYRPLKVTEYQNYSSVDSIVSVFSYSSDSKLQLLSQYKNNPPYGWESVRQDVFDYSGEPNSYNITSQYMGPLRSWANDTWLEFQLNANHQKTQKWGQNWDLEHSVWKDGGTKYKYEYDLSGRLSKMTMAILPGYVYFDWQRTTYTYDSQGNLIQELLEQLDFLGNATNLKKTAYTYDSKNRILTKVLSNWNTTEWLDTDRYTYIYYDQYNYVTNTYETRNYTSLEWIISTRETDNYDANGLLTSTVQEYWNSANNLWVPSQKLEYTYGNNNNHVKIDAFYSDGTNWTAGMFALELPYNDGECTYTTNFYSLEIDYTSSTVGVNNEKIAVNEFKLNNNYPNPFNPSTTISYSILKPGNVSLKVYDVLGREVASLVNENKIQGSYSVNFNAANLPSGVYIYQLKSGIFAASKKMILTK